MIGALVALLSLEVTSRLIAGGLVGVTLAVTGATNASPVVLTTSAPHGFNRPAHGLVSGVGGNLGANGLWVLTPTDSTHLKLTAFTMAGGVTLSAGTAPYTSGGIVQIAFPDGSILLGRRNVALQMAMVTPRIVFVPIGSPTWELDPYGGVIPPATAPRRLSAETDEQKYMKLSRQLVTERQRFEVHVTGCATPPDPDFGDFDVTQALYQTLYGAMFDLITSPRARVLEGKWTSQDPDETHLDVRGQKWVGIVEISQPVTDNPLAFVPASTDGTIIVNFDGGASSDQTVIVLPTVPA